MITRLFDLGKENLIKISRHTKNKCDGMNAAFENGSVLEYTLKVARKLGGARVFLEAFSGFDASKREQYELAWTKTDLGFDTYSLKTDFSRCLNTDGTGLVYCRFCFVCDKNTCVYTSSTNNVDFTLTTDSNLSKPFRILFYNKDFQTPDWAKSGVMYHIFVDRFSRGSYMPKKRDDCVLVDDWDDISKIEFPEYAGAPMKNNTFFGGNLYGICEKLPYLKKLGVSVLYLSPIFKAYSNHKYDTGDYETVDEMFGGDEALKELLDKAHKLGMKVILDGVFNHTGDNSKYFNRYGKYDTVGAFQSKDSPYFDWYDFEEHPNKYKSWWGIEILPKMRTDKGKIREYFTGDSGIVQKWLDFGTDGWRLDVADELPDEFLDALRTRAKNTKSDSLIIGEVWENAADKVSYGKMRKYFLGSQLDSVMNYPIKNAICDFVLGKDAKLFYDRVTDIYSSYPPFVSNVLMNILSTHDTERILTVLSEIDVSGKSNAEIAKVMLSESQRELAEKRLLLASVLQFTLPGMPSVFYGDEAGIEGFGDPFCRSTFPWGRENKALTKHYTKLCKIKSKYTPLHDGELCFAKSDGALCAYERKNRNGSVLVIANASDEKCTFSLPANVYTNLLTGEEQKGEIEVSAVSAVVLYTKTRCKGDKK